MTLGDSPFSALMELAASTGLRYRTGPFSVCLRSNLPEFLHTVAGCYGAVQMLPEDEPCHYHVSIHRVSGLRRWLRPQVQFTVDGMQPFDPFPLNHAFPMYEWGLNWCIGTSAHQYVLLHSAVVEKDGRAVILPAIPGSGKSTLCAGLVGRGWRLLSDEFGVLRHEDGKVLPLPRAAPLKNNSIDVIRQFAPVLEQGPLFPKTRKGTVAHMWPPAQSLQRQHEAAQPRWIIFPRYQQGAQTELGQQARIITLTRLVNNSFNYPITMADGFNTLIQLVRRVDSYTLKNGDLGEAVATVEKLLQDDLQ